LLVETILAGAGKQAPRVEDACCEALSGSAIDELQGLDLCTNADRP
jgi:hypothetical protein